MSEAGLVCVDADCEGDLALVDRDGPDHRFECVECGLSLEQELPGALGTWARELAPGAG